MKCKICGFEGKSLVSHLKKHNISGDEYKRKYNVDKIHCMPENQREYLSNLWKKRMKEDYWISKYSQSKKSIWNYTYWMERGMGELDAKEKVKQIQSRNSKKRDYNISPSILTDQYWIKNGYSKDDANAKISEIQSKLSSYSKRFSGKKHTKETRRKISKTMSEHINNVGIVEWASHFGDMSDSKYRSNAEIEIYQFVNDTTDGQAIANAFLENYNVDILYKNKVIEYFGIYWHCHPDVYEDEYLHPHKQKSAKDIRNDDAQKIIKLKEMGYDTMVIWENEYMDNKLEIENKIKRFIYDS